MPKDTIKEIAKILDSVRPSIQMHGGDVEFESYKDGIVHLKIHGACVGCPMAQITFHEGIGEMLREKISEIKEVRYS